MADMFDKFSAAGKALGETAMRFRGQHAQVSQMKQADAGTERLEAEKARIAFDATTNAAIFLDSLPEGDKKVEAVVQANSMFRQVLGPQFDVRHFMPGPSGQRIDLAEFTVSPNVKAKAGTVLLGLDPKKMADVRNSDEFKKTIQTLQAGETRQKHAAVVDWASKTPAPGGRGTMLQAWQEMGRNGQNTVANMAKGIPAGLLEPWDLVAIDQDPELAQRFGVLQSGIVRKAQEQAAGTSPVAQANSVLTAVESLAEKGGDVNAMLAGFRAGGIQIPAGLEGKSSKDILKARDARKASEAEASRMGTASANQKLAQKALAENPDLPEGVKEVITALGGLGTTEGAGQAIAAGLGPTTTVRTQTEQAAGVLSQLRPSLEKLQTLVKPETVGLAGKFASSLGGFLTNIQSMSPEAARNAITRGRDAVAKVVPAAGKPAERDAKELVVTLAQVMDSAIELRGVVGEAGRFSKFESEVFKALTDLQDPSVTEEQAKSMVENLISIYNTQHKNVEARRTKGRAELPGEIEGSKRRPAITFSGRRTEQE